MIARTLVMLNDRAELNCVYRSKLISELDRGGWRVESRGLLGSGAGFARTLFQLLLRPGRPVISSNLRANLVALSLPWLRGLVILNGLGRHRRNRALRRLLVLLVRLNSRKVIAVQSYADYRYLRRLVAGRRLEWVPGSGGRPKPRGPGEALVIVQRDDKIALVAPGLIALINTLGGKKLISIVGCQGHEQVAVLFKGHDVKSVGRVRTEDIFLPGGIFIQPSGYGDGFPHTLADAIASGMEIWIARSEYVRCGLARLGGGREEVVPGWLRVIVSAGLQSAIAEGAVTAAYAEGFKRAVAGAEKALPSA